MSLNAKMANAGVNAEADALAALLNSGYLRIYDGTQPTTGNTAITTQNQLAELRFGNPAFGAAVAGVITANAITKDSDADASGKATWCRCFRSDGVTPVMDGNVGTVDGAFNLVLNSDQIQIHAEVSVESFLHTVTK